MNRTTENMQSEIGASARLKWLLVACTAMIPAALLAAQTLEPIGNGHYEVGTTNMRVVEEFHGFGDERINAYLSGYFNENGERVFVTDVLEFPQDAWVINVGVPDDKEIYGPIAGVSLPVLIYVTYPTSRDNNREHYPFPFSGSGDTEMHHMQGPGEKPIFAENDKRYPLVLLSHGRNVHGIWDVGHARSLASHGYIVISANYGDLRIQRSGRDTFDLFFRPLAGKAILDHVLSSEYFGSHIDPSRIATSGHSMGGFTSLALAGGRYLDDSKSVYDPRVSAVVAAAPWVGGTRLFFPYYLFGENNSGLSKINAPVLAAFASNDEAATKSSILPAMEQLSGPLYVIELVNQPHVFEPGSWQDLEQWELLFLSAYLKKDPQSLERLRDGASMRGGNSDLQHFDLQRR